MVISIFTVMKRLGSVWICRIYSEEKKERENIKKVKAEKDKK